MNVGTGRTTAPEKDPLISVQLAVCGVYNNTAQELVHWKSWGELVVVIFHISYTNSLLS